MTKSLLSTFKLLAFCAVLLLTATHMKAQSKWDKKGEKIIEKSEADYKKGDYLTAEIRASRYPQKNEKTREYVLPVLHLCLSLKHSIPSRPWSFNGS